jgi:hypothetical protein
VDHSLPAHRGRTQPISEFRSWIYSLPAHRGRTQPRREFPSWIYSLPAHRGRTLVSNHVKGVRPFPPRTPGPDEDENMGKRERNIPSPHTGAGLLVPSCLRGCLHSLPAHRGRTLRHVRCRRIVHSLPAHRGRTLKQKGRRDTSTPAATGTSAAPLQRGGHPESPLFSCRRPANKLGHTSGGGCGGELPPRSGGAVPFSPR